MVAQLQPRVPQSGFPRGVPSGGKAPPGQQFGTSAAAARAPATLSDYDLTKAQGDFNAWQAATLVWKQNVAIPIDDFYEFRQPTVPFFQVLDADGAATVLQYISPIIYNYTAGTSDLIRAESAAIVIDPADNPEATREEIDDTAGALRFCLGFHIAGRIGNIFEQVKFLTAMRGTAFVQVSWLDADDADAMNDRFPIRWDCHDMMDIKWQPNRRGGLKQVLLLKKKLGTEIPPSWLDAYNPAADPAAEYDVLEYWDETSAGALINGTVVKPLALHGYVNMNGDPACPFVAFMHKPRAQRIGQVAPLASGVSQRAVILGSPLCEGLLGLASTDSKMMSKRLHNYNRTAHGLIVGKGLAMNREGNEAQIDMDAGLAILNDTPDSSLTWLGPPNLDAMATSLDARIQQDMAGASAAASVLGSQVTQNVSGTSANHQTSFQRAKSESLTMTLEEGWGAVFGLTVAMMRNELANGAADIHAKQNGGVPPTILPTEAAHKFWYGDQEALPQYKGGGIRDFVPATLSGIRAVRCVIEPGTRVPTEVEAQQALAMEKSQLADLNWLRANKLHMANPQQVADDLLVQQREQDPADPWGQFRRWEALVNRKIGDLTDPAAVQRIVQQVAQQREQVLTQLLMAGPQQAAPPAPAPGAPPQGPPGMPPPGGGVGQMPIGQPGAPPFQPPQLMATPPMQAMPPMGMPPSFQPPMGGPFNQPGGPMQQGVA